jgi:hypothetical protein
MSLFPHIFDSFVFVLACLLPHQKVQLHQNQDTNFSSFKLLPKSHPSSCIPQPHTSSPTSPAQANSAVLSDVKSQPEQNTHFQEQEPAPKKYNKHTSDTCMHKTEVFAAKTHNKLLAAEAQNKLLHHILLLPPSKLLQHTPLLLRLPKHQLQDWIHCCTRIFILYHHHQRMKKSLHYYHQTTIPSLFAQQAPTAQLNSFQVTTSMLSLLVAPLPQIANNYTTQPSKH